MVNQILGENLVCILPFLCLIHQFFTSFMLIKVEITCVSFESLAACSLSLFLVLIILWYFLNVLSVDLLLVVMYSVIVVDVTRSVVGVGHVVDRSVVGVGLVVDRSVVGVLVDLVFNVDARK